MNGLDLARAREWLRRHLPDRVEITDPAALARAAAVVRAGVR